MTPQLTHTLPSTHHYTYPPDVAETIADIDISCRAAVDILNDLLTFEKLER